MRPGLEDQALIGVGQNEKAEETELRIAKKIETDARRFKSSDGALLTKDGKEYGESE